ncbi:MAG TPA: hypothetical protein VEI97_12700 [bacterium]|nr:hypothetical protein [bacterium]
MSPPTLTPPRHETFAIALAQGYSPALAYRHAGFSGNNLKARSARLARNKDIALRVAHLKATLPRINTLRERYAPSALLLPETKEQMSACLWQIATGERPITSLQFRAVALLCRLNGWHLTPQHHRKLTRPNKHTRIDGQPWPAPEPEPQSAPADTTPPAPPPLTLTPAERAHITRLAHLTIQADLNHTPLSPKPLEAYISAMADLVLPGPPSAAPTTPGDTASASQPTTPNPPEIPKKSPSQPVEPEPVRPETAQAGTKNQTPPNPPPSPPPAPPVTTTPPQLSATSKPQLQPPPTPRRPAHDHWSDTFRAAVTASQATRQVS